MAERQLKAGVAGLGLGAARIVREMELSPSFDLYAAADIDPDARQRFHSVFPQARVYETVEQLAADPEVEAVWLSTPNRLHAEHTELLAAAGKHIMVQKPMSVTLQEAERMCDAADRNNVKLLTGHSQAYSTWVRLARQIVRSGELGKLRAVNVIAYNSWLMSTRKFEDLDPGEGGGIVYRNAPHQIDCIRLIGGGLLKSVRGAAGQWMEERPYPGYYAAYMEFVDGTPAVAIQNSFGYFNAQEMIPDGAKPEQNKSAKTGAIRKGLRDGTRDEAAEYQKLGIGRAQDFGAAALDPKGDWLGAWYADDLGIALISCEGGDIRQSPNGIFVYDDSGVREYKIARGASPSTWYLQLRELYNVVALGQKDFHNGRWGMATLEAALAITESARSGADVQLTHQVEMGDDYDIAYAVEPEEIVRLA
jgi:phthalate 4,5-cis-dihydrodiol dehydrogenase